MKDTSTITFPRTQATGFSNELRKRIHFYFKENNLKKQGDWRVYHKTLVWLLVYSGAFVLILTGILNIWAVLGLAIVMGIAMAATGLTTMHDANHGSYARQGWINKLAGATLCLFGGNPFNWKMQHNVLHHTYTNIADKDEDIDAGALMKFSPTVKVRWFHRFQHYYSPLLYCLMTLSWAVHKDFGQLMRFNKMGMLKEHNTTKGQQLLRTILIKLGYFGYMILLPLLVTDLSWWQVGIGFLSMHFTAGLMLSLVFQSAHVVENTEYPEPQVCGTMEDEWMVHQLRTTANFAANNKVLSWFAGGLNFQVEHHLFPNISHIHYPAISNIVRKCALEFKLPYHEAPTFLKAIISHFRTLKLLGRMA